jgi:hypothetical protein
MSCSTELLRGTRHQRLSHWNYQCQLLPNKAFLFLTIATLRG